MNDITINDDIQTKVDTIITKRNNEKIAKSLIAKYIEKCVSVNICPKCGNELLSRQATYDDRNIKSYDDYNPTLYCNNDDFIHVEGANEDYDDN